MARWSCDGGGQRAHLRRDRQGEKPFGIIWNGQIWNLDVWAISKASKAKGAALDFVQFSTASDRLAERTRWISYGPVRKSSQDLVAEAVRVNPPTYGANFRTALANDFEFWSDYQDEINQRWSTWMARREMDGQMIMRSAVREQGAHPPFPQPQAARHHSACRVRNFRSGWWIQRETT